MNADLIAYVSGAAAAVGAVLKLREPLKGLFTARPMLRKRIKADLEILQLLGSVGLSSEELTERVENDLDSLLADRGATGAKVNLVLVGAEEPVESKHGSLTPTTVFVKVPKRDLEQETTPITFHVEAKDEEGQVYKSSRESIFIGPRS